MPWWHFLFVNPLDSRNNVARYCMKSWLLKTYSLFYSCGKDIKLKKGTICKLVIIVTCRITKSKVNKTIKIDGFTNVWCDWVLCRRKRGCDHIYFRWMLTKRVFTEIQFFHLNVRPDYSYSCCRDSGWLLPVCTDSCSTNTVANGSSTWLRLIAVFGLGLVKPYTFTEANEHEQSGRTFMGHPSDPVI
jgi:hypothetical protein